MDFQPQSIDTNHSSMELHPSQPTGPISGSSMTSSVPRPLGPNTRTSRPHPAPIFAITGEATSTRFLFSRSAGSITRSLSSPSPATTNVQPVQPFSDTSDLKVSPLIGFESIPDMLQWDEKQQSITSGRQLFYRGSHGVNHPSMGVHPSQFEFRRTSQPRNGPTVPVLATTGETTSTHVVSLCGSGSTTESLSSSVAFNGRIVAGSITYNGTLSPNPVENARGSPITPSDVGPILAITSVQPVESSNGTSTLQVTELEDVEVTCLLCGGAFLGYQASGHLRETHPTLARKNDRSLCPLCTTTGTTTPAKEVTNFCRHFQKHHKVLRFKCSRCSYTAFERWNVQRHVEKMREKSKCVKD